MALSNPIDAYLQAAQMQNQNRNQMNQDIAGIGQGLGSAAGGVAALIQQKKKKDLMNQLLQAMRTNGAPQQGPALPGVNMGMAGAQPPASGMGAPAQDNSQQIQQLMMQMDPQAALKQMFEQQDPYKKSLMALYQSETQKNLRPPKPSAEYQPVPGMLSKGGSKPIIFDKFTGNMKEGDIAATPNTGAQGGMASTRANQFIMQDLPSRSAPTTAAGAAYGVKVSARQGKALIAKPGSPQQIALAASDLARSVQRSAPQMEVLQGSSYSNNFITQMNQLTQKLTADPSGKDVPKIRRQIFDLLDDLDKTAQPWIEHQLKATENIWHDNLPPNWDQLKKRELGEDIPDIKFQDSLLDMDVIKGSKPKVGGQLNGKKIVSVEPM